MADHQKKPDEGNNLLIMGIAGVVGMAILGIVGLAAFGLSSGNSSGPNNRGAQVVTAADPTNPAVINQLTILKSLADPNKSLAEKLPLIDKLNTNTDLIESNYLAISTISAGNKTKITAEVVKIRQAIGTLQAQINTPGQNSTAQIKEKTDAIQTQVTKITQLAYDTGTGPQRDRAVALANSTAQTNNDGQYTNGKVVYPYVWGKETLTTGFDCSGFITYVLKTVGVIAPSRNRLMTVSLPSQPDFKLVAGDPKVDKSTLSTNDVKSKIRSGEIVPGDLLISGFGDNSHVVMYLGKPSGATEEMVAESTTKDGSKGGIKRSGPQRESLNDRLTHGGAIRYVFRPPYNA